jgi:glyoxylase-like metal-dependent hydrolase (beta-lactamase superfamily II)
MLTRSIALGLLAALIWAQDPPPPVAYRVYAIHYATLADFPVASLVAGADRARRADIAMMLWLIRSRDGRIVLFDSGFYGDQYLKQWNPQQFVRPDEAIARMGVKAEEVSDVVISHVHWDHLDGAGLFPRARVWIQRAEVEHYVDADGRPLDRGIDARGAALVAKLRREGRLKLADGDGAEIIPGIIAHTGGRHTYASQYVSVRTPSGTVVLASDNLYLYENHDRGVPIAQTFDAAANRQSQRRMRELATDPRWIVPGHDPLVFERFPRVAEGVVAIPR